MVDLLRIGGLNGDVGEEERLCWGVMLIYSLHLAF